MKNRQLKKGFNGFKNVLLLKEEIELAYGEAALIYEK